MARLRECLYNVNRNKKVLKEADETIQTNPTTEATTEAASDMREPAEKVKELSNTEDYMEFVNKLDADLADPKFKAFLQAYYKNSGPDQTGDGLKFVNSKPELQSISILDLQPTQSEIDGVKTLTGVITPDKFTETTVKDSIAGNAEHMPKIIVYDKYIIDGHHRWSKVFAINPNAKMNAYVFTAQAGVSWQDMLKAMQLAIAATTKEDSLGLKDVKGMNLLTASINETKEKIAEMWKEAGKDATLGVIKIYNDNGYFADKTNYNAKDDAGVLRLKIAANINRMKDHVAGASERKYMPQTNDASLDITKEKGLLLTEDFELSETEDPLANGWIEI